jgi:hypothetical protein
MSRSASHRVRATLGCTGVFSVALLGGTSLAFNGCSSISLPGKSYSGPLPLATSEEADVSERLRRHVQILAGDIGERNRARPEAYRRAQDYIVAAFRGAGYVPRLLQERNVAGAAIHNIEVELAGTNRPTEFVIIGAHYDSEAKCPGANDNASGVAALLELARLCSGQPLSRTVRFVAFYDEEDFGHRPMGSQLYAKDCRQRQDNVVGMVSIETIGCYKDAPHSQHYPLLFHTLHPDYSRVGNFIAFIGNSQSHQLVAQSVTSFRAHCLFPSEALVAPWYMGDAGRSDHGSFWKENYPGLMVTDTADFRYDYYHEPEDTPDKLDYDRAARVTVGLIQVVRELAKN